MLDHDLAAWVNREVAKYAKQENQHPGSPKETKLLDYWSRERPRMCRELGPDLTKKLAFVLVQKEHEAVVRYLKAGWPATDAENRAAQEFLIKEPESRHPTPVLSDLTSMSAIQKN